MIASITLASAAAVAQSITLPPVQNLQTLAVLARLDLPEAPAPALPTTDAAASSSSAIKDPHPLIATAQADIAKTAPSSRPLPRVQHRVSGPYQMTIGAGQVAPALTSRQKVIAGTRESVSTFALVGEVISAGYSHISNGSPNYGTNSLAFGSRAGAAFARGTSQNIFSKSVLAPVLHEDLRYYQLGSSAPIVKRAIYAGTRPLITRTDAGHRTPNISLLGGYLGAAYLTRTYNPVLNQSNTEVLKIYGTSLGGAALGDIVREFLPDIRQVLHLSRFSHD